MVSFREEIRDEVNNIITAVTMQQNVQEKVIDELRNLFDTKDEDVLTDSLPELLYLEMVIKENLRLLSILTCFVSFSFKRVVQG